MQAAALHTAKGARGPGGSGGWQAVPDRQPWPLAPSVVL